MENWQQQDRINRQARNMQLQNVQKSQDTGNTKFYCNKCGRTHGFKECPAYGKTCNICSFFFFFMFIFINHFSVKCRNKIVSSKQVNELNLEEGKESTFLSLDSVEIAKTGIWTDLIVVDNNEMLEKLDTSTQLNVMPYRYFKEMNKKLEKTSVIIKSFGGFQIKSLGKVKVIVKNKDNEIETCFEVIEYDDLPILGLKDCIHMNYNLLQKNEIKNDVEDREIFIKNNIDVFTGLGNFPECPLRRVPFKITDKLKETLEAMCELKLIEKCEQPSE